MCHCRQVVSFYTKFNNIRKFCSSIRPGRRPLLRPLHTFVVMTTTHCQDGSEVASCDSTLPNGYIRVKKAYTSIYYAYCKKPQMLGDVAVLELEEDVAFDDKIQPICLNSQYRNLQNLE